MYAIRCKAGTWYLNGIKMESLRQALEVVFNNMR